MQNKFHWVLMALVILASCQKEESPTIEEVNFPTEEVVNWGDPTIVADDLILTEKQSQLITEYNEFLDKGGIEQRGAFPGPFTRWPNCVVHYKFDTQDPIRTPLRDIVLETMQQLEDNTRIEFRYAAHMAPRSSYVLIEAANGSAATIGFGSSAPTLQLEDVPNSIVTRDRMASRADVRHELGHVVGLIHEHQRSDRDNNIIVNVGNITCFSPFWNPGRFNATYARIPSTNNIVPYDRFSIMTYASCACADTGPTLAGNCDATNAVLTDLNGFTWGARNDFRASDFAAIDAMYTGCSYSGGGGGGPIRPGGGPIQ
ncbi:MAG: hypothetical protein HRU41_00935 [Saprospiraceae bacterium]|nr:hypothetical protein [Saprospiraceae bacterium]